ncbi:hypothetical protein KFK09_022654 [Dendrobium nobile]|uniref:Uncharacterized protein n=1 Tax=Dendrobium nobile TaxID=94219 RepID=A0A8T3AJU4_DENNO|nr:hypothetical protein KFK09_022654 [Dendrobium nobile]
MVGGGIRRDDAAPGISSKNVFAALETLKKKKKSSVKDPKLPSKSKGLLKTQEKEPEPSQVFWIPTPLNKSWADVDDDDDDYYKTAPVLPGWGAAGQQQEKDVGVPAEEDLGIKCDFDGFVAHSHSKIFVRQLKNPLLIVPYCSYNAGMGLREEGEDERCEGEKVEGDHTVAPNLLHLAPPVALEEFGEDLQGKGSSTSVTSRYSTFSRREKNEKGFSNRRQEGENKFDTPPRWTSERARSWVSMQRVRPHYPEDKMIIGLYTRHKQGQKGNF